MRFETTVPVLCYYAFNDYLGVTHLASKMIHVYTSHFIEREFDHAMQIEKDRWEPMWSVGPRPIKWRLLQYLPYHGMAEF